MQQQKVFMESPSGDVKEVLVTDPRKDLVPLMVQGYHQVQIQEPHQPAQEVNHHGES
jgi:hypothetical protein